MRKFSAVLTILVALTVITALFSTRPAQSQPPVASEFQIVIDNASHAKYGLFYPVTYTFTLPAGVSNLTAQYRYATTDAWTSLPTMTSANFFNGISAARFDYPNNTAFVSIRFSDISDVIYVRILDATQQEIAISYNGMPLYYDNRHSAATVSLDDWDWAAASTILTAAHIHYAIGIWSNFNPDWPTIQYWYNQGYLEPAGHTRDHPCTDAAYQADGGYDYEIAGVRDDIKANLTLREPYVTTLITPCGFESTGVRAAIVKANYLADRGAAWGGNAYTAWGGDGAYLASNFSYSTFDWAGTQTAARRDAANAAFDTAYTNGGIYHLTDHPADGYWVAGSYLAQHINYISNRLDVWYASYGELYLYHFVQERGMVTVSPIGAPLPTFTPTFTPTTAPELTNPADISTLPDGTNVLLNFNNFPDQINGAAVPANYGGLKWTNLVEGPPWAGVSTWNIYITYGQLQGSITFPRPVLIKSLLISSGTTTTFTLSSPSNADSSITIAPNTPKTLSPGWVYPITSLTIKSNTFDQVLDDLRFIVTGAAGPTATPTATFTATATATATNTPTATATPKKTSIPTSTNTPLPTATNTALPTATNTALPTSTNTPQPTATNTALPTATNTALPTSTNTPLPTATNTPQPTATNTPLPTSTNTPQPTATNTPLPTATNTALPTATSTALPTVTSTALPTATNTPLPTATNTPQPTATNTPLPTATNTPLPTATNTPLPTVTNTPLPTATNTPQPTATNTPLPTATNTPQPTATSTPLPTATNTPVPTATSTPLPTATNTPLPTATNTPLPTPTFTPLPTATNTPLPTATFTPSPTATNTPIPTATFTPTLPPTATATLAPTATATPLPDLIFADGFETGSLSAWSSSVTNGGNLSVSSAAALGGVYGLQSTISNNTPQYVQDNTPNAEPRYRARFYFNPNNIAMNNGNSHSIFIGYQGTTTNILRIDFRRSSGAYQLRAGLVDNNTNWQNTNWFTITSAAHYVELDWSAATAAGTANGYLTFWIDGVQQTSLTGVANDTRRVDMVRLGTVSGIDTGTRGTYYLDTFESRRSTYIGK